MAEILVYVTLEAYLQNDYYVLPNLKNNTKNNSNNTNDNKNLSI